MAITRKIKPAAASRATGPASKQKRKASSAPSTSTSTSTTTAARPSASPPGAGTSSPHFPPRARAPAATEPPPSPPSTTATTTTSFRPTTVSAAAAAGEADADVDPLSLVAAATSRTPFERRVWRALCAIPRGRTSTYGLLAAHLSSSPRAVGNALRRNPFAPLVPCHRVVATGGGMGGFKGSWPGRGGGGGGKERREGTTIDEKRRLLRAEGVRLDGRGEKVLGSPWDGWKA